MTKSFLCMLFWLCETFFANFFNVSKRSPFQFFFNFATEWMLKKSRRIPLLHFSALCDLPETSKKFGKNLGFFLVRVPKVFCASYLGLVRLFSQIFLMSPKGPLSIFFSFETEWMFKKPQRVPLFTFFGTMRLTGHLKKFQKMEFFPRSGTGREYLTL